MPNILELIARHARLHPASIALRSGAASLSYAELDRASGQLANRLTALGVASGATVALCYPRCFDQITAALAIMRAGGAYVPVDPAWPVERVRRIVEDSGAAVFIAPRELSDQISCYATPLSLEDDVAASHAKADADCTAESLAYIIYTSGSTGAPKGVEITHGNLSHLIAWHCEAFGVSSSDHASHLAGLGFDASVWEVWPYLATGASVSLVEESVRTNPILLQRWLVDRRISLAFVPTPLAEPMMTMEWPQQTALRFLLTGGDVLHTAPRAGLPFPVVNNYGPTECTVVATSGIVPAGSDGVPSIGRPILGATVHIVNEQGKVAPVGETGELLIGGAGVGRGYRNLPELTALSFVPDLLSPTPGGRLYKTGDRATMLPDGQISFRGRIDGQEKIRGQRIELGEIVCALDRHPSIAFSTVVARGSGDEKHLVAYVLPVQASAEDLAATTATTAGELREFLANTLPSAMVPAKFVLLRAIPLNANGKIDPAILPQPSPHNTLPEAASRAPGSLLEQTILGIVRRLLKSEQVGVDDDFFLIGGHSLMATQLVMRLRDAFGVSPTLREIFEAGTVAELAACVETTLVAELASMSEEEAARQVAG